MSETKTQKFTVELSVTADAPHPRVMQDELLEALHEAFGLLGQERLPWLFSLDNVEAEDWWKP